MNLWQISEQTFDPAPKKLHSQESVYTIGNGYFCTRGTFEEGYPQANPATLLYGVFDEVPIAVEELANAPDWTPLQLLVNGERFRLDKGHLLDYQRTLDMEHGVLHRTVRWESATGARLLITIERFASLADEHVGIIRYSVTAERASDDLTLVLLASFNTAVGNYNVMHWETADQGHQDGLTWLKSETRRRGVELAQTMSFTTTASDFTTECNDTDFAPNIRLHGKLAPGETLTAEKMVVMYTSRDGGEPLTTALHHHQQLATTGYDALLAQHQEAWHHFWQGTDILIGFALGRTSFWKPLVDVEAKRISNCRYSTDGAGPVPAFAHE